MSLPNHDDFSGHIRALLVKQPGDKPLQEDIDDDIEGEKETIPNLTEDDCQWQQPQPDQIPGPFSENLRASITNASKGVTEKNRFRVPTVCHSIALTTGIDPFFF